MCDRVLVPLVVCFGITGNPNSPLLDLMLCLIEFSLQFVCNRVLVPLVVCFGVAGHPASILSLSKLIPFSFQFVCDRVLVPLVVCFGIVGNVLSLVVLTRKEMASPTNCFLTALAISDLSLLLLRIPVFFGLNPNVAAQPGYVLFSRYYTVIM